jgi:hypothetical protein
LNLERRLNGPPAEPDAESCLQRNKLHQLGGGVDSRLGDAAAGRLGDAVDSRLGAAVDCQLGDAVAR